jgi:hypothetical protein
MSLLDGHGVGEGGQGVPEFVGRARVSSHVIDDLAQLVHAGRDEVLLAPRTEVAAHCSCGCQRLGQPTWYEALGSFAVEEVAVVASVVDDGLRQRIAGPDSHSVAEAE